MPYLFRQLFPGFHLMQCPDNIALIQKSPISVAHRPIPHRISKGTVLFQKVLPAAGILEMKMTEKRTGGFVLAGRRWFHCKNIAERPVVRNFPGFQKIVFFALQTSGNNFTACINAASQACAFLDRKSTRLNSSHVRTSRMPSSA